MKILVLNCGSSSVKYQVFEARKDRPLAKGLIEKIGEETSFAKYKNLVAEKSIEKEVLCKNHEEAIKMALNILTDPATGVIKDASEIEAVGHRVVHGGETFSGSVLITDEVKKVIKECFELAPLHNPPNYEGIVACEKVLKDAKQVAVFDTAFHQTLPEHAFIYALPYEFYQKYKIRRYGFHGTSHRYVSQVAAKLLKKEESRIITCHLGNGASMAAVKGGKSIDTTMGFTPLEGLVMGTRSGDIDPAIVIYLQEKLNMTPDEVDKLLNKKSGVLGLSGISNDFRELLKAASEGNRRAQLAVEVFCYRVKKYIGAYMAVLGGADCIVFTAGIGENNPAIREKICSGLEELGVVIDKEKNDSTKGTLAEISAPESRVKIYVIPTNEELLIAKDTYKLITGEDW